MARVQLAINVPDLAEAKAFYSGLFGVAPHKEREGYANFEIADPPLKLVLVENRQAERLNHLGVEVESSAVVADAATQLAAAGLATQTEQRVVCCNAEQDKVWVRDPAGMRWEIYTVTDDMLNVEASGSAACCVGESVSAQQSMAPNGDASGRCC